MAKIKKMKKMIEDSSQIMQRHSAWTRDEMVARLDEEINNLPEDQRASVTFDIDEYGYPYDTNTYYALFMTWLRPENDEEEKKREAEEAARVIARDTRERAEFERLKKHFGE